METIGSRIRQRRKEKGMTQVQLASASGVSQQTISAVERGDSSVLLAPNLMRLAAALECSPHWLQTGEGHADIKATQQTAKELMSLANKLDTNQQATLLAVAKTLFNK